jgi:hypothetical protein
MSITVYGGSDDLVEVEGDIIAEFYAMGPGEYDSILVCSDGTILTIKYDGDGCWRLNRSRTGTAKCEHVPADGADEENYSDRITLTGDIEWVVYTIAEDFAEIEKKKAKKK